MKTNAIKNNQQVQQKHVPLYASTRLKKRNIYQKDRGASFVSHNNADEIATSILFMFNGEVVDFKLPMTKAIDFVR